MKISIMQPYLFPYIGYFQLIKSVETFVIYDDVNYIKQGWINRNRILINEQPHYFTIKLVGASSFKKICEIELNFDKIKLLKTIYQAYKRAPQFDYTYNLIEKILHFEGSNLSRFVSNSIEIITKELDINTKLIRSSENPVATHESGSTRILSICKFYSSKIYINPIGGIELYNKEEFRQHNIELNFLRPTLRVYKQFSNNFENQLSIIDVLMFNSLDEVKSMLGDYQLI